MDVNEELKFFLKDQKKIWGSRGGGVRGEGSRWGDQGGCDRSIEDFWKIHKQKKSGGRGGGGLGRVGGGGVRVDVNEELKFL